MGNYYIFSNPTGTYSVRCVYDFGSSAGNFWEERNTKRHDETQPVADSDKKEDSNEYELGNKRQGLIGG